MEKNLIAYIKPTIKDDNILITNDIFYYLIETFIRSILTLSI